MKKKYKNKSESYEPGLFESDDTFAFIAGYTSWGIPFGVRWEELSEEEKKDRSYIEPADEELPF